jgi:hypothetical protein
LTVSAARRCKACSMNAAVLPVPVCAHTMRSCPPSISGMAWACTGGGRGVARGLDAAQQGSAQSERGESLGLHRTPSIADCGSRQGAAGQSGQRNEQSAKAGWHRNDGRQRTNVTNRSASLQECDERGVRDRFARGGRTEPASAGSGRPTLTERRSGCYGECCGAVGWRD